MMVQFVLSWLATLLFPIGFLIASDFLIWSSGILATILIIKIGLTRCKNCGERYHLHMRSGIFAKLKIGFPLGGCDHCGESYI